jgi:hypothetical protein
MLLGTTVNLRDGSHVHARALRHRWGSAGEGIGFRTTGSGLMPDWEAHGQAAPGRGNPVALESAASFKSGGRRWPWNIPIK